MSQPIILDGGAQMVTITLPSSFKELAGAGVFSVSPDGDPFVEIVIRNQAKAVLFSLPILDTQWTIEINTVMST